MTDTYEVPTDPADPVAAALELVVQIPCSFADPDDVDRARRAWQDFAGVLELEGVFAGMSWHDARHAASLIAFLGANCDDADAELRRRAAVTEAGCDGMTWDDRAAMVRALTTAARVLEIGK
jgi:hypothetical protein